MSQNEIATDTAVDSNEPDGHPNEQLLWKNLPRNEEVDGVEGMVRAHICTPDNARDLLVASMYHESMKGYVEMAVWEFHEDGGYAGNFGYGSWNKAVSSFQIRPGHMVDCDVCSGTAVEQELTEEVIEVVDPIDVARRKPRYGIVYLDNHGQTTSGDVYDVDNKTGARTELELGFHSLVRLHPYVYIEKARVEPGSDRWYEPDGESLKVTLGARYPDPTPEVLVE